ncbi:MAG: dynamin family protein [Vulcanimicrobiaceae bacterium]|jgi:GTPase SAR1 family protein/rubrerythrin
MRDLLLGDQVVPPEWSRRFSDYYSQLREWINTSAYPALMVGPLQSDPMVTAIPTEIAKIGEDLEKRKPIPIALVGVTGVGKSTLLNALLEEDFLPVGAIGSQTAAFVTIQYAPSWEITCEYIDLSELERLFSDASMEIDESSESGSPEDRDAAQRKIRALLGLADDESLPPKEKLEEGPSSSIRETVAFGTRTFTSSDKWKEELELHAKGRLWPITKAIDVRGPFKMLESGVVISDLPGAGDLNRARLDRAATAVRDAGQILIAADGRGLQASLIDQLEGVGQLPHRLFMGGERLQVILVGTSLDAKVPDPETDEKQVLDLGIEPCKATEPNVFRAICDRWTSHVRAQFVNWLREKAAQFLPNLDEHERAMRVDQLMQAVEIIPTSAKDWTRHTKKRKMRWCRNPEDTGLPELKLRINALADSQIQTTIEALGRRLVELSESVLSAIERSENALGANIDAILSAIENSHASMKEAQDHQVQIVENLRLNVLDRFQQIRERVTDKIENAASRMREVGRKQVQTHLDGLHWASLRATVRNEGSWFVVSRQKSVNLRDAMGGEVVRLVPQAWVQIADERLRTEIESARKQVLITLSEFTEQLQGLIQSDLVDPISQRTAEQLFESSKQSAQMAIDESSRNCTELLGKTSKELQEQVNSAVVASLKGVCDDCTGDYGVGWKNRSVARIINGTEEVARDAEQRCVEIADEAFESLKQSVLAFCDTARAEMVKMGERIPVILRDAMRRERLATPEELRKRLCAARVASPSAPAA